jgi:hypothetical protein
MRRLLLPVGCLAAFALAAVATDARAEGQPTPLLYIPDQADLVVVLEQPRQLIERAYHLEWFKRLLKIDAVREAYDSTNSRRFFQLVGYFEKQLGVPWPEMIDRVAGGGAAFGLKFGSPAPVLLAIQGKDEAMVKKFAKLALEVADQELARQEAKERPVKGSYQGIETVRIGDRFHAAVLGPTVLLSNDAKALQMGIDLARSGGKTSAANLAGVASARKLLPEHPALWAWLNFEPIKKLPQAKILFAEKQNDTNLTVVAGGTLNLLRRSAFVCAGLSQHDDRLGLTIRLPSGWDGMPEQFSTFRPAAGQAGTLPLLEPKNVILSSSYFFDAAKLLENRDKLFNKQQLKAFDQFDKNSGRFLGGVRFSKLVAAAGSHQRIVVAQQTHPGYKTRPNQLFPAGAVVIEMRNPEEFGKSMETVLRSAALLVGFQFELKLTEEKRGNYQIVGYRFPEGDGKAKKPRRLPGDIRYNFSPSFVRVGNQFVISSTIELARDMVDVLEKEAKAPSPKADPVVARTRIYAKGGAAVLRAFQDQLLTQAILNRALSPEEAQRQVNQFIGLVAQLGYVQIQQQYHKNSFHYDILWRWGK